MEKKSRNVLPIEKAVENINNYFDETLTDRHGRYLSWRHCYNAFRKYRNSMDDDTIDYLCLHLSFYLASWGMYRGSSFLLQKDYKVHESVVRILLEKKYDSLNGISARELIKDENLDLLFDLSVRIEKLMRKKLRPFPEW